MIKLSNSRNCLDMNWWSWTCEELGIITSRPYFLVWRCSLSLDMLSVFMMPLCSKFLIKWWLTWFWGLYHVTGNGGLLDDISRVCFSYFKVDWSTVDRITEYYTIFSWLISLYFSFLFNSIINITELAIQWSELCWKEEGLFCMSSWSGNGLCPSFPVLFYIPM